MYRFVSKLSGSKTIKGLITDDVYVEIGFCGKISDIKSRLGLKHLKFKNEYLAVLQLRYPPSFKDTQIIVNMQAALTLQANYIISFYPSTPINKFFSVINRSIYKVIQTPILENKAIGISQVLSYWPKRLDDSCIEKMKNQNILNQIDIFLNKDNELFKDLRCCCDQFEINIQWINENDFETYKNLIENAIDFCQRNIKISNQLYNLNITFKQFTDVNSKIGLQKAITKTYELLLSNQAKPLFNINLTDNFKEKINYNLKNLSISYKDISSLYTIYFSCSNSIDVKYVSQIFPNTYIFNNYLTQKNDYEFRIIYCGSIDYLIDEYDLKGKVKKKNDKTNLAFIYIEDFQIDKSIKKMDDFLLLDTIIASKCDATITIANKESFDLQLQYANKLKNSLNAYDLLNKTNKQESLESKYIYLIYEMSKNIQKNIDENNIKKIPSHFSKYFLDIKDMQSCNSFFSTFLNELPDLESKKMFDFSDFDVSLVDIFSFHINLFQDCIITAGKQNDAKNSSNLKSIKTVSEFATLYSKRKNDDKNDDFINYDTSKTYTNKNINEITININSLDETIYRVTHFIINLNFDTYSISNIESFFAPYFIKLRYYNNIIIYLMKVKKEIINKYIDYIASDFIGKALEVDISQYSYMKKTKEFIFNSIIHINKDFIEQLKDQLENDIKDDIFNKAEKYCTETKKSPELKYLITDRVFKLIESNISFEKCREEIDQIYNDLEKRNESIQLDKNQIARDSLKYVLTVKESLKEMTVEITCNEDLEKEIPQDF